MGESLFFTQKRLLFTSYIPTRSYKTKVQKNSGSLYRNNLSRLPLMFSGRLFLIQQEKAARFFVFHIALIRHYCALESENEGKEDKPHMKKTDKAIIIDCLWKMLALAQKS